MVSVTTYDLMQKFNESNLTKLFDLHNSTNWIKYSRRLYTKLVTIPTGDLL